MANEFFEQTDVFINTVVSVEKIRKALSPQTKTMINELGTMHENAKNIPNEYWNLAGAQYAYEFARLSLLGNYFIYPVWHTGTSKINKASNKTIVNDKKKEITWAKAL